MASFASSATTCGARKHAWTNMSTHDLLNMVCCLLRDLVLSRTRYRRVRQNRIKGYVDQE